MFNKSTVTYLTFASLLSVASQNAFAQPGGSINTPGKSPAAGAAATDPRDATRGSPGSGVEFGEPNGGRGNGGSAGTGTTSGSGIGAPTAAASSTPSAIRNSNETQLPSSSGMGTGSRNNGSTSSTGGGMGSGSHGGM